MRGNEPGNILFYQIVKKLPTRKEFLRRSTFYLIKLHAGSLLMDSGELERYKVAGCVSFIHTETLASCIANGHAKSFYVRPMYTHEISHFTDRYRDTEFAFCDQEDGNTWLVFFSR